MLEFRFLEVDNDSAQKNGQNHNPKKGELKCLAEIL